jgi:hypothetical protein
MDTQTAIDARNYIADRRAGSPFDDNWIWMLNTRTVEFIEGHYAAAATLDQAIAMISGDAYAGPDGETINWNSLDDDEMAEDYDEMESYHEWVAERGSSIFTSGASSEDAMFLARQEAAYRFPDEHRKAMAPRPALDIHPQGCTSVIGKDVF